MSQPKSRGGSKPHADSCPTLTRAYFCERGKLSLADLRALLPQFRPRYIKNTLENMIECGEVVPVGGKKTKRDYQLPRAAP